MNQQSPACVGIILDGNRRWAKQQGLPKLEGHRRGLERLVECARWVRDRGIANLVVYAFSIENWQREEEEVSYLMLLLQKAIEKELRELGKEKVRIRFVGTRDRFSPQLKEMMQRIENETREYTFTLWVCLSYGGRAEIVAAAASAASEGRVTEESVSRQLWTAGMPDPDIIIRTSGEHRLSGFLTWQSIYSELFFTDTLWPDFSEKELDTILAEFAQRERRHGK